MKFIITFLIILFFNCARNFLIVDDVNDVKSMGYKITAVDTLNNNLYRVWVRE